MCGRYTSRTSAVELGAYFDVDEIVAEDLGPRYNVAPTDPVYAVAEHQGRRSLGTFRWGLIPFWAKSAKIGSQMINARCESLMDKPAFRRSFTSRRCIIPADGFYEWKEGQPHYISRVDGEVLAMAGLWDSWRPERGSDEGRIRSCAVITGKANEAVASLHDRMPVVLAASEWGRWLDPEEDDPIPLLDLLRPPPAELFAVVRVGGAVGNVRNQGPELIEPLPVGA